jgi:uncharacterized membrane protein
LILWKETLYSLVALIPNAVHVAAQSSGTRESLADYRRPPQTQWAPDIIKP